MQNKKHERYLAAKREGKSVEECVKAALPGTPPDHPRFRDWVENAEEKIPEIKNSLALMKAKKKTAPAGAKAKAEEAAKAKAEEA